MNNCYFDSPFTIQRLKYEPEVAVYRNDTEFFNHYYMRRPDSRENNCRCNEPEWFDEAVAAAIATQFSNGAARRNGGSSRRCPRGYVIR